ncbi:hypothetical protein [Paenibacillus odorifer]|uniref:hypothetical protein n=1 Tax=Paenibacillus odorifer TaxID=189426 RepID=UPI0015C08C7D|nr:hypothetical protein [Paenibacillus odorifer]
MLDRTTVTTVTALEQLVLDRTTVTTVTAIEQLVLERDYSYCIRAAGARTNGLDHQQVIGIWVEVNIVTTIICNRGALVCSYGAFYCTLCN